MEAGQSWIVRSSADLGRAIAAVRGIRGLTQQELAERVGVERTYLAKVEAGASVLLLDRALRIVRRLGAEVVVTLPGESVQGRTGSDDASA